MLPLAGLAVPAFIFEANCIKYIVGWNGLTGTLNTDQMRNDTDKIFNRCRSTLDKRLQHLPFNIQVLMSEDISGPGDVTQQVSRPLRNKPELVHAQKNFPIVHGVIGTI